MHDPSEPRSVATPPPEETAAEDVNGAPSKEDESAIEEAAREQFGLRRWDCPALYRETAEAATDTDLPFWMVLMLSGAIATLGLALNQTAVVIGAMLIAPLLGPLLGLSLGLAVGDGRLALQTSITIVLGAAGVIALAALLTILLPFQNVTAEIAARARPTTLDLAIAVFSGLAGAAVTVSREKRLSASIPGVAIAVALIPPLGVAGFGIATARWPLVKGSLLLFGANLGGIVLSGMLAFLLVGMHRADVVEAARRWHKNHAEGTGLAARISNARLFRRLRVFGSPWARVALVLAFVVAVAVPLSTSLQQFIREAQIESAVSEIAARLQSDGRASVLSRDVLIGEETTTVEFRLATTDWVGEDERMALERDASAAAGEPVTLGLEQLLASAGDLDALAERLPTAAPVEPSSVATDTPSATLDRLRNQVEGALDGLALPDSVYALGAAVSVGDGPPRLTIGYAAPRRLGSEAESMLARQAAAALGVDPAAVRAEPVTLGNRALPPSAVAVAEAADLLTRYPSLRLRITADSAAAAAAQAAFRTGGVPPERIVTALGAASRYRFDVTPTAD